MSHDIQAMNTDIHKNVNDHFAKFIPYNPSRNSFYNSMHEPAKCACWEGSITHNIEQFSHLGLGIIAKVKLNQSQARSGSLSDVNLHHPQTAAAGDTSGPGIALKYFIHHNYN